MYSTYNSFILWAWRWPHLVETCCHNKVYSAHWLYLTVFRPFLIATALLAGRFRLRTLVGARNVLLPASVHTCAGTHPTLSRGIKKPGCGVDHLPRVMLRLFIPLIHLRAEVFRYRKMFNCSRLIYVWTIYTLGYNTLTAYKTCTSQSTTRQTYLNIVMFWLIQILCIILS